VVDPATVADRSRLPDGSAHQPSAEQQISECRGVPPTPDWTWAPAETSTRARVFNGSSDSNPCRYPQHRGPTGRKLHPMQTAQEQPCDLMHVPKTLMIGCGCDHSPRRGQFNTFGFSALSPSEQTSTTTINRRHGNLLIRYRGKDANPPSANSDSVSRLLNVPAEKQVSAIGKVVMEAAAQSVYPPYPGLRRDRMRTLDVTKLWQDSKLRSPHPMV
jgi:hypothetical protein